MGPAITLSNLSDHTHTHTHTHTRARVYNMHEIFLNITVYGTVTRKFFLLLYQSAENCRSIPKSNILKACMLYSHEHQLIIRDPDIRCWMTKSFKLCYLGFLFTKFLLFL